MIITFPQIIALLPILIVSITVLIIMLSIIISRRNRFVHVILTVIGLSVAIIVSIGIIFKIQEAQNIAQLMYIDNFALLYTILVLIASLTSSVLSYRWLLNYPGNHDEFYLLLLISSIGSILLVTTNHLAILFVGIELTSLPLFGLIGYSFIQKFSLEASIKYIILSGVSSSFLLFGIALIYAATGFLSFTDINNMLLHHYSNLIFSQKSILVDVGLGMMIVAFGFKLSCFPFHLWTPDVYQGAPSSVSMYLTTGIKIAVVSVLIRFLLIFPDQYNQIFYISFSIMACCSMLFGNLMAIKQNNIKRVLAYSSITHIGYLLIGLISLRINPMALEAIGIYLISYLIANIGAFGIISIMSSSCACIEQDADSLLLYRGLFWYKPILSIIFTIIILSLAGIPLTLGFIGKFYLLMLGVNSQLWWIVIIIAISSIIGVFYYLRIMISLYLRPSYQLSSYLLNSVSFLTHWNTTPSGIIVIITSFCILFVGLYPQPIIYCIRLIFS